MNKQDITTTQMTYEIEIEKKILMIWLYSKAPRPSGLVRSTL